MGNFFNKQQNDNYQYLHEQEETIISNNEHFKQKLVHIINVQTVRNLSNTQKFVKNNNFFIEITIPLLYNNHPYNKNYKNYKNYKNIKSSYFPSSLKIIETNQLHSLINLPASIKYFHLNYFCKKCINSSTDVKSYIKIPHKIIKIIISCKKIERDRIIKLDVYNKYIKKIYFVNNDIETLEIIKNL